MTGITLVDSIDIYTVYGIFILKGGYSGLVCFPPLKEPETNDWHEDDGIEVDLLEPFLDSKTFEIIFGVTDFANIDSFLEMLSDGGYHDFVFNEIKISRKLRLVSHPSNKVLHSLGTFSLQFADDFPLSGFIPDQRTPVPQTSGFEIDDLDIYSSFGIRILEGEREELSKSPEVKENMLINVSNQSGLLYDDGIVKFQPKEIGLRCLYIAEIDNNGRYWWQDYYNFLHSLIQPGERLLYVNYQNDWHSFYYKSANVGKFEIVRGKVWCEFTLNLVLMSFRVGIVNVLGIETGAIVIVEDKICAIELN